MVRPGHRRAKNVISAREVTHARRVVMRDAQSYCSVLLDNNRKPICRMYFNNMDRMRLGFFTEKQGEVVPIKGLDDIYQYADKIKATISAYDQQSKAGSEQPEKEIPC